MRCCWSSAVGPSRRCQPRRPQLPSCSSCYSSRSESRGTARESSGSGRALSWSDRRFVRGEARFCGEDCCRRRSVRALRTACTVCGCSGSGPVLSCRRTRRVLRVPLVAPLRASTVSRVPPDAHWDSELVETTVTERPNLRAGRSSDMRSKSRQSCVRTKECAVWAVASLSGACQTSV